MVRPAEADEFLRNVQREATFRNTQGKVTQGSDTAARHAAQKEFPNPIESAPLPHLTFADLLAAPLRKIAGATVGESVNARNARIGADAARALSATGAEHARLIQGIRDTLSGRARAQLQKDEVRKAGTLLSDALGALAR